MVCSSLFMHIFNAYREDQHNQYNLLEEILGVIKKGYDVDAIARKNMVDILITAIARGCSGTFKYAYYYFYRETVLNYMYRKSIFYSVMENTDLVYLCNRMENESIYSQIGNPLHRCGDEMKERRVLPIYVNHC